MNTIYKQTLAVLAVLFFAHFTIVPAIAEDAEATEEKKNSVIAAAEDFMKDLNRRERRHFSVLYGNYNMTKVVETVQGDVGLAVDKCGEDNPDMKEKLKTRYKDWKAAIKPVLTEAGANVNNMVFAQEYAKPAEIRKFFKLIDKTREEHEKQIEKIPVTTPEACQHLLEKMDETQENLIHLLEATLISLPQALQAEDEEAIAKEKEKAEKEAAKQAEKEAKEKAKAEAKAAKEKEEAEAAAAAEDAKE